MLDLRLGLPVTPDCPEAIEERKSLEEGELERLPAINKVTQLHVTHSDTIQVNSSAAYIMLPEEIFLNGNSTKSFPKC